MSKARPALKRYRFVQYRSRPLRNPLFSNRPKSAVSRRGMVLGTLAAFCILMLIGGVVGYSPWIRVQAVTVEGTETIDPEALRQLAIAQMTQSRWIVFPQRSRLFFDVDALRHTLSETYVFEQLDIRVEETLAIRVKEKVSQIVWIAGERVYYVDLKGIVIRELTAQERAAVEENLQPATPELVPTPFYLPIVYDDSVAAAVTSDVILSAEMVAHLIALRDLLKEQGIGVHAFHVENRRATWVSSELERGFDALADLLSDPAAQVSHLVTLLATPLDESTISYIDLRFGDHVYYK